MKSLLSFLRRKPQISFVVTLAQPVDFTFVNVTCSCSPDAQLGLRASTSLSRNSVTQRRVCGRCGAKLLITFYVEDAKAEEPARVLTDGWVLVDNRPRTVA